MKQEYRALPRIVLQAELSNKEMTSEEIAVCGALGCFSEKSPDKIWAEEINPLEDATSRIEKVFEETSGRGHGSVLDQSYFTFVIDDCTRLTTLQLCLPEYLAHEQQSLRRAKANRGFFVPDSIASSKYLDEFVELCEKAFSIYEEGCALGLPAEDCRYILPLYTKTSIQTSGDARELMHLDAMSRRFESPSANKFVVARMINLASEKNNSLMKRRANNYETLAWYPSAQLFALENSLIRDYVKEVTTEELPVKLITSCGVKISEEQMKRAILQKDEVYLANLKHVHFEFLACMSLACLHQAIRQRTWNQSLESIYDAAFRNKHVFPQSLEKETNYYSKFVEHATKMGEFFQRASQNLPPSEVIGVMPHSLLIFDLIHVNGWNAIHAIGKRTCTKAQWEIRHIAEIMSKVIEEKDPILGAWSKPQCVTYRRCPESKPCGRFKSTL